MVVFSSVVRRDPLVTRFNASSMYHNGDHAALPQPGKVKDGHQVCDYQ